MDLYIYNLTKRFGDFEYDVDAEIRRYQTYRDMLRPFIIDTVLYINQAHGVCCISCVFYNNWQAVTLGWQKNPNRRGTINYAWPWFWNLPLCYLFKFLCWRCIYCML